jgi:hypothetical protein
MLQESAGALVPGQSTGNFSTESGTASKTVYIAEEAYTFEMTDTSGDEIRDKLTRRCLRI